MAGSLVRAALVSKTKWSKQTLSANVSRLRKLTPMDTATAQAVLAHQRGLQIHRYLDRDALAEVQRVLPLVASSGAQLAQQQPTKLPSSLSAPRIAQRARRRSVVAVDYDGLLLDSGTLGEAREMAVVYPLLYALENSMREVIKRVLRANYGADWWDTALATGRAKNVRDAAEARRTGEDNKKWHQRRGAHPINYTDFGQLGTIILCKRQHFFPAVFGGGSTAEWFEHSFMAELEPSRNVVCHMNPLSSTNVVAVGVALSRWRTLLKESASKIPAPLP